MSQRVMGTKQALLVGNLREVLVEHLLTVHYRTNLQQIELTAYVHTPFLIAGGLIVDIASQLYLHRTAHAFLTVLHGHLQQLWQREHLLLQHATKGDDLSASLVIAVIDTLVRKIEGGGYIAQRSVGVGLLHFQFLDIETVIHLELRARMLHIEGIETCLRLLQGDVHLAHLQNLRGMIGTNAERLTAVNDIFTQSEGQRGNSFLGSLVVDGIIVQRTQHAGDIRIIMVSVLLADHFLQDDGHLLLVNHIGGGCHIRLGVLVIDGGIHTLDGSRHHLQHLILIIQIGYHIGTVNAGERLVMAVFQQRTAADGNRRTGCLEEGKEVGYILIGQLRTEEMLQDFLVRGIAEGNLVKIVGIHELIEHIRTEHHRLRDAHLHAFKLIEFGMLLDNVIQECQATALAAQ